MPAVRPAPKGLRIRKDVWRRECAQLGAITLAEKENLLGVDMSTISRAERGALVGGRLVVAALDAFPAVTFNELFERVYSDDAELAA